MRPRLAKLRKAVARFRVPPLDGLPELPPFPVSHGDVQQARPSDDSQSLHDNDDVADVDDQLSQHPDSRAIFSDIIFGPIDSTTPGPSSALLPTPSPSLSPTPSVHSDNHSDDREFIGYSQGFSVHRPKTIDTDFYDIDYCEFS